MVSELIVTPLTLIKALVVFVKVALYFTEGTNCKAVTKQNMLFLRLLSSHSGVIALNA